MKSLRIALAAIAIAAAAARAQDGRDGGLSVDITIGAGRPLAGEYLFAAGPALDAIVARSVPQHRAGSMVFAAAGAAQFGLPAGDKCVFNDSGGCLENLPRVRSIAALAGWETSTRSPASFRVLVGPGMSWVDGDDYGEHATALGIHASIDAAVPARSRVAFVASIRGTLLPASPLDVGSTGSIGIGVRLR
jgi:hypothetical protein